TLVLEPILIYFLRRLTVRLPAWVFLPTWVCLQISLGLRPHSSNVAFWAHVGGFVVGAVISVAIYKYILKDRRYSTRVEHRN
ncbi:MAG: rhomboid family intramembrane serine protease, partial [Candidatus Binatia bacterium]